MAHLEVFMSLKILDVPALSFCFHPIPFKLGNFIVCLVGFRVLCVGKALPLRNIAVAVVLMWITICLHSILNIKTSFVLWNVDVLDIMACNMDLQNACVYEVYYVLCISVPLYTKEFLTSMSGFSFFLAIGKRSGNSAFRFSWATPSCISVFKFILQVECNFKIIVVLITSLLLLTLYVLAAVLLAGSVGTL